MKASSNDSIYDCFFNRVDKSGDCWIWLGNIDLEGYGRVQFNLKTVKAHRFSYEMFVGRIPDGLLVCHHCDNPSCVRPEHLFVGTQKDNHRDCEIKGRHAKGEKNGRAKITKVEAGEIRELYKTGKYTQQKLGFDFGISQGVVSKILLNELWK